MYNKKQLTILISLSLLAAGVVSAVGTGMLASVYEQRAQLEQSLDAAIDGAVMDYRIRSGVQARYEKEKIDSRMAEKKVRDIMKESRGVRLQIADVRAVIDALKTSVGSGEVLTEDQMRHRVRLQKRQLIGLLRGSYLDRLLTVSSPLSQSEWILKSGTDAMSSADVEKHVVLAAVDAIAMAERFGQGARQLGLLERRHAALIAELRGAERVSAEAAASLAQTAAEMEAIQRTVEEVHEQVLALQKELKNIDERLRRKAARDLISKGLLDPGTVLEATHASAPEFHWPAYGQVTAGFRNSDYESHFGVPHHGADIRAAQGSAVYAAADGVVFLARNGGATGYSYILIGHQGGYATLYGHMSVMSVAAGDEVTAGQEIGKSGGRPGTRGAGPMTTGPHLHFEVIKDGKNIDPVKVLP